MKLKRQTQGSVVCPSCRRLVGVAESNCPYCGRSKPGMWGFGPWLQRLGGDLGFEKVDNQVANFLTEGDVVDQPDGSVLLYPNRSDADLMTFRLGVSFAFR